ncbi:NACHT domain-containing protein [Kitasatospora cineracea]|uniref:NACHT domain-containing protein n=1 Tax=Kitasatospora cineracea TaxID=88074 RepID=UPI00343AB519
MTHNQFSGGRAGHVIQADSIGRIDLTAPAAPLPEPDPDARRLAGLVGGQWRAEAAARGLFGPLPLPVPWRTEHRLADHPELAGDRPATVYTGPAEISEMFLALPERRLVVLGGAGSGKTSLAVLLLLRLIDRLGPEDPVPVLVPLVSWEPGKQPLREWLAERLTKDYPTVPVARLLAERRLLPVLDGFDELPPEHRADALRALNRSLAPGDPLILTSRAEEYRRAAGQSRVLHASAALRSRPIPAAGVGEALRHHAGPQQLARWQPVLDETARHPAGPVARALANPLLLSLAREVHGRPGADPADLLRFPDRESLTHHLLDRLVPTLAPHTARTLGGIAAHDEPDLAWWRLYWRLTRPVMARRWCRALAVLVFLAACAVIALVDRSAHPVPHAAATVTAGALLGLAGGGYESWARPQRPPRPVRSPRRRAARTAVLLLACPALLLAELPVRHWVPGSARPLAAVSTALLLGWFTALLLLAGRAWLRRTARAVSAERQSSPAAALRGGRRRALTAGAAVGWAWCVVLSTRPDPAPPWQALGAGLALAAAVVLAGQWGAYTLARLLLAAAGRIPLRYAAFLAEAHRLGLLRRAGSVYQFRHRSLRERLARSR